jgi:two-component system KDP operon response regulator KdpE
MRRVGNTGTKPIYWVGNLVVDNNRREVKLAGNIVELTHTEFDILLLLIQNAGKVITHRQIIQKVWGSAYEDESRLLRVNISNLRHKLEPNPNQPIYILTELGVGYRMMDETT